MRENEGKFGFLALVLKFGFEGEVTTAFCKMRWLVGKMTVARNLKDLKILNFFITSIARKRQI